MMSQRSTNRTAASEDTADAAQHAAREFGKDVYIESSQAIAESGPKVILNVGVAVLAWLFGNLVFIPISRGLFLGQYAVTEIISLIVLVTMAVLVIGAVVQIRRLSNAAAGMVAYLMGARKGEVTRTELDHYRTAITGIVMVGVAALAFLLFSTNLSIIHPALSGILLIVVVLWAMLTLWRSGRALAAEIGVAADELAKSLEARVG
jgi:hypothetical protein